MQIVVFSFSDRRAGTSYAKRSYIRVKGVYISGIVPSKKEKHTNLASSEQDKHANCIILARE